jgi:hypothetical protein
MVRIILPDEVNCPTVPWTAERDQNSHGVKRTVLIGHPLQRPLDGADGPHGDEIWLGCSLVRLVS